MGHLLGLCMSSKSSLNQHITRKSGENTPGSNCGGASSSALSSTRRSSPKDSAPGRKNGYLPDLCMSFWQRHGPPPQPVPENGPWCGDAGPRATPDAQTRASERACLNPRLRKRDTNSELISRTGRTGNPQPSPASLCATPPSTTLPPARAREPDEPVIPSPRGRARGRANVCGSVSRVDACGT